MRTATIFLLLGLSAGSLTARAERFSEPVPPALLKANDALLAGDYDGFLAQAVALLSDQASDDAARKSAQSLLDAAFKDGHGRIGATLPLPKGLRALELSQRRLAENDRVAYVVEVKGQADTAQIDSISLVRYPDTTIVTTGDDHLEGQNGDFWIKHAYTAPVEDGLYHVTVRMKDGGTLDAWVPVYGWVVTDSPRIVQPRRDESVYTPTPVVEWRGIDADDASYEPLRWHAHVVHNDAPDWAWDTRWSVSGDQSSPLRYTVGQPLSKGRYLLDVVYERHRRIGELTLSSEANGRIAFYVR